MLNNVVLVGRLTRDPEIRQTTSGNSVASFTLASDDSRRGPNNEKQTVFINVSIFGKQTDVVSRFTRKGSLVGITGRLIQRKYTNRAGVEVTATEIVAERIELMDPKGAGVFDAEAGYQSDRPAPAAPASQVRPEPEENGGNLDPLLEDDLPF